jgi:5-deoxy-glucuronate isomerase
MIEVGVGNRRKETALIVLGGSGFFEIEEKRVTFARFNPFRETPTVLHFCEKSQVKITANDSKVTVLQTSVENIEKFEYRYFGPKDCRQDVMSKDVFDNTAYCLMRTVFDGENSFPQCKLAVGELINFPGRWSLYPHQKHAQPEIHFFYFSDNDGYGHAEIGEDVLKINTNDLLKVTRGKPHNFCAAPGTSMYSLWAVRHLPGALYSTKAALAD